MMRKNVNTGMTTDFGIISNDCLDFSDRCIANNEKPTSSLTKVNISIDQKDDELESIGSDGENDETESDDSDSSDQSKQKSPNKSSK